MSIENWLKEQGVSIGFKPISARLNIQEALDDSSRRSIAMRLQLERREDVRLPDKRSLKDASWGLYIVEGKASEVPDKREGVGVLSYFAERSSDDTVDPEGCHIQVILKSYNFNALLVAVQAGRVPDYVNIKVRGLEYDWEPDGSGKVWDIEAQSKALITDVSFGVPLTQADPESSNENESENTNSLPATTADVRAVQDTINNHITVTRSVLKAVIGVGILILVLWLLRN